MSLDANTPEYPPTSKPANAEEAIQQYEELRAKNEAKTQEKPENPNTITLTITTQQLPSTYTPNETWTAYKATLPPELLNLPNFTFEMPEGTGKELRMKRDGNELRSRFASIVKARTATAPQAPIPPAGPLPSIHNAVVTSSHSPLEALEGWDGIKWTRGEKNEFVTEDDPDPKVKALLRILTTSKDGRAELDGQRYWLGRDKANKLYANRELK